MQIRVGYELIYNCPQPTPMMLMLNIHYTRASDIVIPDHLTTTPSTPITAYRDIFGNWCDRIVAPKGQIRLASTAVVKDTGEPDVVVASAQQHSIQDLPEETLMFLLGSRYCETDLLSQIAWNLFGHSPPGWARVQAICDFVHNHITFGYEYSRSTKSAFEAFNEGTRSASCRRMGQWISPLGSRRISAAAGASLIRGTMCRGSAGCSLREAAMRLTSQSAIRSALTRC